MDYSAEALANLVEIARLDSLVVARRILAAIDTIEFSAPAAEGWTIVRFTRVDDVDVATFRLPAGLSDYEVSLVDAVSWP